MIESNKKFRIAVICGYPFPEGMAATTRIITYSKGLVENNVDVDVILFNPTEKKNRKCLKVGVFQGIKYCYPFRKHRLNNKFIHLFEMVIGLIMTFFYIINENRKHKFEALILSTDSILYLLFFTFLSKTIHSKSIFIFDEYPIPIRKYLKEKIPNYKRKLYSFTLRGIDGYIAMTDNLANFYNRIRPKSNFILPTITDVTRFDNVNSSKPQKRILCYMGNMELSKDNVDNIILAFEKIHCKFLDLELHLYGIPPIKDKFFIENLILKLKLSDKVFLKGKIAYYLVPQILKNAHILVTSQPNTKRAEGGFPTKLGEYLAANIPCLLTDVGEIKKYITDMETAFICSPENPEEYAGKLDFILTNYSFAQKVALQGKEYLTNNYSHKAVAKELLSFIINV